MKLLRGMGTGYRSCNRFMELSAKSNGRLPVKETDTIFYNGINERKMRMYMKTYGFLPFMLGAFFGLAVAPFRRPVDMWYAIKQARNYRT